MTLKYQNLNLIHDFKTMYKLSTILFRSKRRYYINNRNSFIITIFIKIFFK